MNRRIAIQRISMMLGGMISTPLMAGIMQERLNFGPSLEISLNQEKLLAEVADVIIPTTTTPGAKAAGAEKFIVRVIRDCYELPEQEKFYQGLDNLENRAKASYNKSFVDLTPEQKHGVVLKTTSEDKPFFMQMKGLTVTAYFTSEVGATEALDYLPIPGRFDGSWTMPKGQKTWAL
ncbi:gluconate 2-dehydrogenase subunit 3 family protein [Dyadobacter tibetensis]|uniref:gluconate 2-dehydrogenase subunit 3 family protein n=1 Tax=Dyadobacter tibetensis TaxID=1211851 RepID=UPI00046F6C66|nr:gluconate 2-dehydrogenase subunit 3 family protein [Dyadobacter tibetensis]